MKMLSAEQQPFCSSLKCVNSVYIVHSTSIPEGWLTSGLYIH